MYRSPSWGAVCGAQETCRASLSQSEGAKMLGSTRLRGLRNEPRRSLNVAPAGGDTGAGVCNSIWARPQPHLAVERAMLGKLAVEREATDGTEWSHLSRERKRRTAVPRVALQIGILSFIPVQMDEWKICWQNKKVPFYVAATLSAHWFLSLFLFLFFCRLINYRFNFGFQRQEPCLLSSLSTNGRTGHNK